jgi:hypothetical protein
MPIRLDWEIEDEELPQDNIAYQTQPAVRGRRWWRYLALAALALAVAAGVLWLNLRHKQNELQREIRAMVELELDALHNGDRDLFLSRQDPEDPAWLRAQEGVFDRHVPSPGVLEAAQPLIPGYTDDIHFLYADRDSARLEVGVVWGEQEWRELWFYRWSPSIGWHHVAFDKSWLGEEQRLITSHFRFSFPEKDATIVKRLAHEMESWYNTLAAPLALGTRSATVLTVEFAYRVPSRTSAPFPPWILKEGVLTASSPHQGPLAPGETPSPALRQRMAGYVVEALLAQQSGLQPGNRTSPITKAVWYELRDWALIRLAGTAFDGNVWVFPATPLLDALVQRYSEASIPRLLTSLSEMEEASSLEAVLAATSLPPLDATDSVAFFLTAAGRAWSNADDVLYNALIDYSADMGWRSSGSEWASVAYPDASRESQRMPLSYQIESITLHDDIAWAETSTTEADGVTYHHARFLRLVEDNWLLTAPDPAYFGERRETRTENLLLRYFEREATWFDGQIAARLQAIVSQIAIDMAFSLPSDPIILETTVPNAPRTPAAEDERVLTVTSPLITGWPMQPRDIEQMQLAIPLISWLFEEQVQPELSGEEGIVRVYSGYVAALLWEMEQFFPDQISITILVGARTPPAPISRLEEMWADADPETSEDSMTLYFFSYHALFQFLVESYGREVLPRLLDNINTVDTVSEWLLISTQHPLEEVEPAWQAWIADKYPNP